MNMLIMVAVRLRWPVIHRVEALDAPLMKHHP